MNATALQTALYDLMVGDSTLLALLSSSWDDDAVFVDVPQQNADDEDYYPFVSFGADELRVMDSKTFQGTRARVQIDAWSRSNDYAEVKDISDRIYDLLHRQDLTISGVTHVTTGIVSVNFALDPDGHTRRAMMLYEVVYHE